MLRKATRHLRVATKEEAPPLLHTLEGQRRRRPAICSLSLYILDASLLMLSLVGGLPCWRSHSNHSTRVLSSTKGLDPLRLGCKVSPALQRQKMKMADSNARLDPR